MTRSTSAQPRKDAGSRSRVGARSTGSAGAPTSPSARGAPYARTTAQSICIAFALWNGRDPILKERLFGLSGTEGNHGEDVKEYYFYLDSTPTHSYMKWLYKYPQAEYPYAWLVEENRRREGK